MPLLVLLKNISKRPKIHIAKPITRKIILKLELVISFLFDLQFHFTYSSL